ncbi:MAG: hypothetical protein QGG09_20215, partial [Pirellulaceae bacterium]|nr:hypothetical protein [Pirellulaceae bacterium]
ARKAKRAELTGQAIELSHDDGTAVVMNSLAGGEHGVRFKVLGDSWYLTSVRINGSRYGHPNPPRENFHVWLCNKDSEIIADFPFPYAKFARGGPNWVTLMTPPTNVPQDFIISVGFNPTGKKGIFVSRDRHGSGDSLTGLLGRVTKTFNKGDWLIRAAVDQLKIANSLEPRSTAVRTE